MQSYKNYVKTTLYLMRNNYYVNAALLDITFENIKSAQRWFNVKVMYLS